MGRVNDAAGAAQRGAGEPILPGVRFNWRARRALCARQNWRDRSIVEAARFGMTGWEFRRDGLGWENPRGVKQLSFSAGVSGKRKPRRQVTGGARGLPR